MQQASPFTASQVLSVGVESSRLRQSCELFEEIDAHGMHLVPDRCPLKRDPTGLSLVLAAGAACARQCCRHRVRGRIAAQAAFSWRFYPLEIDPVDLCHRHAVIKYSTRILAQHAAKLGEKQRPIIALLAKSGTSAAGRTRRWIWHRRLSARRQRYLTKASISPIAAPTEGH